MTINQNLSYSLNFLRWFAATLVVLGHLRNLLFIDYYEVSEKNLFNKVFYFLTGFGHEAVIVFFVLSGFLVGGEFLKYPKTNENIKIYLTKRFSRIFIVFIPALLIGFLFDFFGSNYFNYNNIYLNFYKLSAMNYDVVERLSFFTFAINLTMFQTSLGETFGSNGPLWSLAYEWWYYLFLPILYKLLYDKNIVNKLLMLFIILILFLLLNIDIFIYFFIWLMGLFIYKFNRKIVFPFSTIVSIFFIVISFSLSRIHFSDSVILCDFIVAISIVFFINNLIYLKDSKLIFNKTNILLSNFSYSLYLFHFPFLLFLVSIISFFNLGVKSPPTISSYTIFIILLILVYVFSYCMYLLFEKNTINLKNRILAWLK